MAQRPLFDEVEVLAGRVLAGERAALARAITLVESTRPGHRAHASALVQRLLPHAGRAVRLGITGVPGVGKSTLIDTLGSRLTAAGHRVAVLAVDPSSTRTGGSILGDKTRMMRLSVDNRAFVRPSPSSGTLGGVAAKTREAMLLCEAAGFGVVIVETVGVGQSETAVCDLVDCFLVLMIAGAGDELQGIKKGVLELADMVAVNKADGDNAVRARAAAAEIRSALAILGPGIPPVSTVSGSTGDGLDALWAAIVLHRDTLREDGRLDRRRSAQDVRWMHAMIEERLTARLRDDPDIRLRLRAAEVEVAAGRLAPLFAAQEIAGLVAG